MESSKREPIWNPDIKGLPHSRKQPNLAPKTGIPLREQLPPFRHSKKNAVAASKVRRQKAYKRLVKNAA